jgi:hypothetical protein
MIRRRILVCGRKFNFFSLTPSRNYSSNHDVPVEDTEELSEKAALGKFEKWITERLTITTRRTAKPVVLFSTPQQVEQLKEVFQWRFDPNKPASKSEIFTKYSHIEYLGTYSLFHPPRFPFYPIILIPLDNR